MPGKSNDVNSLNGDFESRVYRRNGDAAFSRFGDDGLIVVPRESVNLVVNDLGFKLYEMLDGRATVGELAARVSEEYEVSQDRALADLIEILEELAATGAVEVVNSTS